MPQGDWERVFKAARRAGSGQVIDPCIQERPQNVLLGTSLLCVWARARSGPGSANTITQTRCQVGSKLWSGNQTSVGTRNSWWLVLHTGSKATTVKSAIIPILQMRKLKLSCPRPLQWASDRELGLKTIFTLGQDSFYSP